MDYIALLPTTEQLEEEKRKRLRRSDAVDQLRNTADIIKDGATDTLNKAGDFVGGGLGGDATGAASSNMNLLLLGAAGVVLFLVLSKMKKPPK